MKENDISMLDKVLDPFKYLCLYMSTIEPYKGIKDEKEVTYAIPPKTMNDLPVIFDRHWSDYQKKFPGSSIKDFKIKSKIYVEQLIGIISEKYPHYLESNTFEWASIYMNSFLDNVPEEFGIKGVLNREELDLLYRNMENKYIKSRQSDFVAALSGYPLPPNFKPIKWLSAKVALRCFLTAIKSGQTITAEDQKKFADKRGVKISLNKPKNDKSHKDQIEKFQRLINRIKNDQ